MSLHWGCNLVFNNDCCHHQKLKGSRMSFLRHEKSFSQDLNLSIDWGVNHSGWQFMYARFFFRFDLFLKYSYCRDHSILFVGAKWTESLCTLEWRRTIFFQWQHHYSRRKKINTHYQKIKTYFNFPWIIISKQLPL